MTDLTVRSPSTANVVEGFSGRFTELLDRAQFPTHQRFAHGSKRFDVVFNTFKNWCTADRLPGTHAQLDQVVQSLLKNIGGTYNSRAVIAWLIAGDAVPHPFNDRSDALALVELYFQISKVAKAQGIDFELIPRDVRNLIISRARSALSPADAISNDVQLTGASLAVVRGMLETISALR